MSTSLITEPFLRKSFTLIELLIVLVILGVLFSMATFNSVLEKERNARMNLKLAFQAEKDAFAYSAPEERYTTSWKKLLCGDLNEKDRYFPIRLRSLPSISSTLQLQTAPIPHVFFIINQDGILKDNRGNVYK